MRNMLALFVASFLLGAISASIVSIIIDPDGDSGIWPIVAGAVVGALFACLVAQIAGRGRR